VDEPENWGELGRRDEVTLYRHRNQCWSLLAKTYTLDSGDMGPPTARRLSDEEAVNWLLLHGYVPPSDVAYLATDLFFAPGPPIPTPPEPAKPVDEEAELLSNVNEEPAESKTAGQSDDRPAYKRDHTWLDWNKQDKQGPAKIRDRWNVLSEVERKNICPTTFGKVGGSTSDGKKAGREVVKAALKKAEKERGT
jgi:hypothetical protein